MLEEHSSVNAYVESIKDYKEVLTDPNQFLSASELRLGKGRTVKVRLSNKKKLQPIILQVLSEEEHKHEKILLGDMYDDKEFLRWFL